jgi:CRISPR/Cas system-associated exonuclease Cas4 (RecB family)
MGVFMSTEQDSNDETTVLWFLSEAGGEIKRQGERYVDAIRSGEDVQVIELKHKESMEKSSGVAECMNAR